MPCEVRTGGLCTRPAASAEREVDGPHGGAAVGEVLLGITNPSGRLPITYPREPGLQILNLILQPLVNRTGLFALLLAVFCCTLLVMFEMVADITIFLLEFL